AFANAIGSPDDAAAICASLNVEVALASVTTLAHGAMPTAGAPRATRSSRHLSKVGATSLVSQVATIGSFAGSGAAGSKVPAGKGAHALCDAMACWQTASARSWKAWSTPAGAAVPPQAATMETSR